MRPRARRLVRCPASECQRIPLRRVFLPAGGAVQRACGGVVLRGFQRDARGAVVAGERRGGIEKAATTLRNISGAWVKDQKVEVTDGRISAYQVVLEVTFVLE